MRNNCCIVKLCPLATTVKYIRAMFMQQIIIYDLVCSNSVKSYSSFLHLNKKMFPPSLHSLLEYFLRKSPFHEWSQELLAQRTSFEHENTFQRFRLIDLPISIDFIVIRLTYGSEQKTQLFNSASKRPEILQALHGGKQCNISRLIHHSKKPTSSNG